MRISDWSSDVCSSDLLRHQSLRTGLDSFGAEDEWQIAHRRVAEDRAQMLCGRHYKNGIADGEIIKARRRLDCGVQVVARQENAIAVGFVNRASDFLLESPDKDGIAVGGRDQIGRASWRERGWQAV